MRPAGQLRVNNGEALLPSVIAGLGIADLPDFIVGDAIASGEVEVILKGWNQPEGAVHLVTPPGGPRPARVEVLAEFLAKHFAKAKKRCDFVGWAKAKRAHHSSAISRPYPAIPTSKKQRQHLLLHGRAGRSIEHVLMDVIDRLRKVYRTVRERRPSKPSQSACYRITFTRSGPCRRESGGKQDAQGLRPPARSVSPRCPTRDRTEPGRQALRLPRRLTLPNSACGSEVPGGALPMPGMLAPDRAV